MNSIQRLVKRSVLSSILIFTFSNIYSQTKSFVAMEYVGGIGNRILKVWITDSLIFAAKVKGLTSETTSNSAINASELVISHDQRNDPNAYVNKRKESEYEDIDFTKIRPNEFMNINSNNFVINKKDITEFYHNPNDKWGMGGYPHNGRIYVISTPTQFNKKKKREFILIGDQDEKPILEWIKKR